MSAYVAPQGTPAPVKTEKPTPLTPGKDTSSATLAESEPYPFSVMDPLGHRQDGDL